MSIGKDEFDVGDGPALVEFRRKHEEWLSWLWSEEYHALERQIVRMVHSDMAYRVLIEARRCSEDEIPGAALNGLLASFMDQSYVETQVLAVGRLIDKRNDVVSVSRLLKDVHAHCYLLTREIYVAHDGLPYEPQIEAAPTLQNMSVGPSNFGLIPPDSEQGKHLRSWARHEKFDRLSGVSPSERSRSDCIRCRVFKAMEDWLREVDEDGLKKLRNKFIAHAADRSSRGSQGYSGPSSEILDKVAKAHRQIIRVFTAISDLVRFEKVSLSVNPPLGFLNGLDRPYSSVSISDLQGRWNELRREREKWVEGITDDLFKS